MMMASMLLKSWAMPPVSCPTASIFCICRICASAASRDCDLLLQAGIGLRQLRVGRNQIFEPPAGVGDAEYRHGEHCDQRQDRSHPHAVVRRLGIGQSLLQHRVLVATDIGDDRADAVHGDLALIAANEIDGARDVALIVEPQGLGYLRQLIADGGHQRLDLAYPIRIARRRLISILPAHAAGPTRPICKAPDRIASPVSR